MTKPPISRNRELKWLAIDSIIPNERTPRREEHFTPELLARLRASIAELGVLEPVIVEPYNDGEGYLLIEGERRWRSAKLQGAKEIPAVIVNKMDVHDQLITMFNIHMNRRGWEKAEELATIKELMERNGQVSEEEVAKELAMSVETLRERLKVLAMGPEILAKIAKGDIDYTSALRAAEVSKSIARKRPEIVEELGGQKAIEKKLIHKAKVRGGISQELVEARRDLTDPEALSAASVKEYIEVPEATIREVRTKALEEAHRINDLARDMNRIEGRIRSFEADLEEAPNLTRLRGALSALIDAAQTLELEVSEALQRKRTEAEA
jgi:ParB family transcriptional regulator, chromosome partitioning protein